MATTDFTIVGRRGASCAMVMEGVCEDTPGVQKTQVNGRARTLTVDHDDSVKPEQPA